MGDASTLRLIGRSDSGGQTNWIVTTTAGSFFGNDVVDGTNSSAEFRRISGLAIGRGDQIYVSDYCVRRVSPSVVAGVTNWVVTTLAGSGSPLSQGSADGVGAEAQFYQVHAP